MTWRFLPLALHLRMTSKEELLLLSFLVRSLRQLIFPMHRLLCSFDYLSLTFNTVRSAGDGACPGISARDTNGRGNKQEPLFP